MTTDFFSRPTDDRRAWVRIFVLSASHALSQSGQVLVMTVTALAGVQLSASPESATLPLALQYLGTMAATAPVSFLMSRYGRRIGFSLGQSIGATAATVAVIGIIQGNFWLFCVASAAIGIHNASWLHLRFAATEAVTADKRARAVSYVILGGVAAAVIGPGLAAHTRAMLAPTLFAGCYVALAALCAANLLLLQTVSHTPPATESRTATGRPLSVIATQPTFVLAVMSAAIGYGVMSMVMTSTPLAVVGSGFRFQDAALVIQLHVLGMYVPSLFSGKLVDRFGPERIIGAGILLNLVAMSAHLAGATLANFWTGLICVGIGWNFMFVGGTTLLTHVYWPEERGKAQALNEFLVFATVSVASLSSGALFSAFGWHIVNVAPAIPLLVLLAMLYRSIIRSRIDQPLAAE